MFILALRRFDNVIALSRHNDRYILQKPLKIVATENIPSFSLCRHSPLGMGKIIRPSIRRSLDSSHLYYHQYHPLYSPNRLFPPLRHGSASTRRHQASSIFYGQQSKFLYSTARLPFFSKVLFNTLNVLFSTLNVLFSTLNVLFSTLNVLFSVHELPQKFVLASTHSANNLSF